MMQFCTNKEKNKTELNQICLILVKIFSLKSYSILLISLL